MWKTPSSTSPSSKPSAPPPPDYAHLPMIVNHMGKPYSKRDGSAFVGEFRETGYLPEALFNFLALLGWAPGDDRELMTRAEMVEAFTFERCKQSAARFDMKKLTWMNGEYISRLPPETWRPLFTARLAAAGLPPAPLHGAPETVEAQIQPRTKTLNDLPGNCAYFFTDDYTFDPKAVEKRLKPEGTAALLEEIGRAFAELPSFTAENTEAALRALGEAKGCGMGALVHPVRVAVSGLTEGPGLFEMLAILGKETVLARLAKTALRLESGNL